MYLIRRIPQLVFALAIVATIMASLYRADAHAQNAQYRLDEGWTSLPDGRKWGSVSSAAIAPDGSIWAVDRCGANSCAGSNVPPLVHLDASGKYMTSIGAGLFVFPHGMHVDREGNVWATDAEGKDGKGHQVFKFSPDGKVLLRLGKAGIAGDGPDTFNRPSAVVTAPNGDIFVADGHGGNSNARIVRFTKDGKFVKAWGRKGSNAGEFGELHAIAMDSTGRVFVGDRGNNRILVFDVEGNQLADWRQFGRPSGIYVDTADNIYVTDHSSDAKRNPGVKRGIRIGNARDGVVKALIPAEGPDETAEAPEGIAADARGNIYGGDVARKTLSRYTRY
jgi:DNA-binding beta-propeller fold protein YncE